MYDAFWRRLTWAACHQLVQFIWFCTSMIGGGWQVSAWGAVHMAAALVGTGWTIFYHKQAGNGQVDIHVRVDRQRAVTDHCNSQTLQWSTFIEQQAVLTLQS